MLEQSDLFSSSSSSNLLRSSFSSFQFLQLFSVFGYSFENHILSFHQVAQQVHSFPISCSLLLILLSIISCSNDSDLLSKINMLLNNCLSLFRRQLKKHVPHVSGFSSELSPQSSSKSQRHRSGMHRPLVQWKSPTDKRNCFDVYWADVNVEVNWNLLGAADVSWLQQLEKHSLEVELTSLLLIYSYQFRSACPPNVAVSHRNVHAQLKTFFLL